MGSPFSMGLNGLVSRNVAGYVRSFKLHGEWKEHESEEQSKVGRVSDESMMLNSLIRVAVERMAVLDSFRCGRIYAGNQCMLMLNSWELNTKMLPTVWQGLAQKNSLTKLIVKFPSNRQPRPVMLVPPIPNLQYLHIFDIDPLCYADDVSLLLFGSKKLLDLKLHWSPRMRESREPSVHQAAYFGRCAAAHYSIPLKSIAVQNFFAYHGSSDCAQAINTSTVQELTYLNSTNGIDDEGGTAFMDGSYSKLDEILPTQLKLLRTDKVSHLQCEFLAQINGLEKLYIVGPQGRGRQNGKDQSNGAPTLPYSPASNGSSPKSVDNNHMAALKDEYIDAITRQHGSTLKHLLLPPQWRLKEDDIALIVRQCPNLEQLGVGVDYTNFSHLRLLVPFLAKLTTIRLLGNPEDSSFVHKMRELDGSGLHEQKIGEETLNREWSRLRYMEIGAEDMIFELGPLERKEHQENTIAHEISNGRAKSKAGWRRPVKKRTLESVQHIDIWRMDSLDI